MGLGCASLRFRTFAAFERFFWSPASACQVRAGWCLKAASACPGPRRIRALVFRTRLKPICKTDFAALAQNPLPISLRL